MISLSEMSLIDLQVALNSAVSDEELEARTPDSHITPNQQAGVFNMTSDERKLFHDIKMEIKNRERQIDYKARIMARRRQKQADRLAANRSN